MLFSFSEAIHDWRGSLVAIVIGAIAGFIAQWLTPGRGFGIIVTIILGIVGGWLGKLLFKDYLAFTHNALIDSIICAAVGAFILALVINLITGNDRGDRTRYRA